MNDETTESAVDAPPRKRGRPPKVKSEALEAIRQAAAENAGQTARPRRKKEPRPKRAPRPEVAADEAPERGTDAAVIQCLINEGLVSDKQVAAARLLTA